MSSFKLIFIIATILGATTFKRGEALGSRPSPTKSMKGVFSSKGLFGG
jgi:hypothetical protein